MLALALALSLSAAPVVTPRDTPVHLGIALKFTHVDDMNALRKAQQDPRSPEYRRWLTAKEFGKRFGQSPAVTAQLVEWLTGAGLKVELGANQLFINAWGTAGQIDSLLNVQLLRVDDQDVSVHRFTGKPRFPASLAPLILNVSGLDTRLHLKRRLNIGGNLVTFGPQDLRAQYNSKPLLDQGYVGQGQKTVVLSTALPSGTGVNPLDVQYFYQNLSDAKAPLIINTLPNPQNDTDRERDGASEFELDVEMHSVGVPGATSITLEVSPASEVFTTGAMDIANNMDDATAVSISLGLCEKGEVQNDTQLGLNEIPTLRAAVIQGTMEGQTWSAATGDNGANDCGDNTLSVDFPSTIPEMVAAGGTQATPAWNSNHAITSYSAETAWNAGTNFGAAGGGVSTLYDRPDYQLALGMPGTMRLTPDISLVAGNPAVATDSDGAPADLSPVEGTSVASPLSAGFYALIASRQGCRLGDPHAALYALGLAQLDGGPVVFHDITTGNLNQGTVIGPVASAGYVTASGWGSLDVAALAAAWPGCPTALSLADGGFVDAGSPNSGTTAASRSTRTLLAAFWRATVARRARRSTMVPRRAWCPVTRRHRASA